MGLHCFFQILFFNQLQAAHVYSLWSVCVCLHKIQRGWPAFIRVRVVWAAAVGLINCGRDHVPYKVGDIYYGTICRKVFQPVLICQASQAIRWSSKMCF